MRIKWDKYEVALLIDTFWLIENDPTRKKEYIQNLSATLRQKAINAGLKIDEVFRNLNGISMQLTPIAHAFFHERPTLSTSVLFEEMVAIYKNDYQLFQSILAEAKELAKGEDALTKNKKDAFLNWLEAKQYKKYSLKVISDAMDDASKYCINKRISKIGIWDIKNPSEFAFVAKRLFGMRLFRIFHRSTATVFGELIPLYKEFLTDFLIKVPAVAIEVATPTQNVPATINGMQDLLQYNEVIVSEEQMKNNFYNWLFEEQKLAKTSCSSYASAVKTLDAFARRKLGDGYTLFAGDYRIIQKTASKLFSNAELKQKNDGQHNRYFAALRKYLIFSKIDGKEIITQSSNSIINKKNINPKIQKTLEAHYNYGINVSSPIEILRFKNNYSSDHSEEYANSDDELINEIIVAGMEFEGKIYLISHEAIKKIKSEITSAIERGVRIVYFKEFYNENEGWLYDAHIMSSEMLRKVMSSLFTTYQVKTNYIVLNEGKSSELSILNKELKRVWGDSKLCTFSDLHQRLPWVPLDKIKYALSYGEKYFWNSCETYTNKDLFVITAKQISELQEFISMSCDKNGSVRFDELPLYEISSENYELSETALFDIIFSFFEDSYVRNSKVITRKGASIDVVTAIAQFCSGKEICKMAELKAVMQGVTSEVRYPTIIDAANASMVRIDNDTFVADNKVEFDVAAIDSVLDNIVFEDGIGLKEITTFNAFPYCGYEWNLFLLESYCRRFSRQYRYTCITPNSRNAGVIVSKSNNMDFHNIMAKAIARANIDINETDVFEFLIASGFMIRRQYANMNELLELAAVFREGR